MEEDEQKKRGGLLLAEISEPFRRPFSKGAPSDSSPNPENPADKKLHFCFHNWSRKGHATSLSRGPPRSGERETLRLVTTAKTSAYWKDGRKVKTKIVLRPKKAAQSNEVDPLATMGSLPPNLSEERSKGSIAKGPKVAKELPEGWRWGQKRDSKWMAPVSGWVSHGGWIPSVGEKTPPPGYFQTKNPTTVAQRPLGATTAFAPEETERVLPKTFRRPQSAQAAMIKFSASLEDIPEGSKLSKTTIEEHAPKRDKAGRRINAEQKHSLTQKAHAKDAVAGHVFEANFSGPPLKNSNHLDPPWQYIDTPWEPDDPIDLLPVTVRPDVVDQTFRACRHEGNMVFGPDQGAGEHENRAQWLALVSNSHDIGPGHKLSPDLKGTVDFNHSLGHQPLADSSFGNRIGIPVESNWADGYSERGQLTQPRQHHDDAPLRPRPDVCTTSFSNGAGRDGLVNARAMDGSGRVVVVGVTKAIGRDTDHPPATECEAFSHLLAMQTEIPSTFKCTQPRTKSGRSNSRTGRFRTLRKCIVH